MVDHRECQGGCEKHVGAVRKVHVGDGFKDWGEFWYCEAAIERDRGQGFTVKVIEEA